jgi:hypothetical protein
MNNEKYDAYNTHRVVLTHLLNVVTEGDVFEFGMGNFSTPMLHSICEEQDRKLLSTDNNLKWFEKFILYKNKNHNMFVFEIDKILLKQYDFFNSHFSVVFVDAAPAEVRQPFIDLMQNCTDYFVVHDTESAGYRYDFSKFKHVLTYKKIVPWTSILSNLDVIDEKILEIFK